MRGDRSRPALIYKATNLINGKFYIGVTTRSLQRRSSEHLKAAEAGRGGNGAFYRAIRKYGRDAFRFRILAEYATAHEALPEERRIILALKPHYNSKPGGEGFSLISDSGRARISAAHKGNKWRLGATHSEETRKILAAHGKKCIARLASIHHLAMAKARRPVVCLNDKSTYESASEAARVYRLAKSMVIQICNRHPDMRTSRGYVFRYCDDPNIDFNDVDQAEAEKRKNLGCRRVRCIDDGREFDRISAAGRAYGMTPEGISMVCRGIAKQMCGRRFEFIGDGG